MCQHFIRLYLSIIIGVEVLDRYSAAAVKFWEKFSKEPKQASVGLRTEDFVGGFLSATTYILLVVCYIDKEAVHTNDVGGSGSLLEGRSIFADVFPPDIPDCAYKFSAQVIFYRAEKTYHEPLQWIPSACFAPKMTFWIVAPFSKINIAAASSVSVWSLQVSGLRSYFFIPPSKVPDTGIAVADATAPEDLGNVVVAAADTEVAATRTRRRFEIVNFAILNRMLAFRDSWSLRRRTVWMLLRNTPNREPASSFPIYSVSSNLKTAPSEPADPHF